MLEMTTPSEPFSQPEIDRRIMETTGGISTQRQGTADSWEDRTLHK